MKELKVLVFGAGGFIGTYLIDALLKHNYDVVASDICPIAKEYYGHLGVPYVQVDISKTEDFMAIKNHEYDAILHLASLQPATFNSSFNTPKDYINVNVIGTMNVLDFCKRTKSKKIIYASSHRNTSGLWREKALINENDGRCQQYSGEYAMFSISESAAQDCLEFYRSEYEMSGIVFRLPPVYGYGPHLEIFKYGKPVKTGFQTFVENAIMCRRLEVWGDSSVGRDIIYVKDVVSAIILAIKNHNASGLYNISTGYRLTLKEEVEKICKIFWGGNGDPKIDWRPEIPHKMDSFAYDNSKAITELGWYPQYDFEKLLIDYKKELELNRFSFLLEKRIQMFNNTCSC